MTKKQRTSPSSRPHQSEARVSTFPLKFVLGLLFITVAAGAAIMMVVDHFAGMGLPGCGPGSGCAKAAASVWGKVPRTIIPTSAVGAAFFIAMFFAWIVCKGQASASMKWIIRLGAAASLFFIGVMAVGGYVCVYCIAAHAANLAFWIVAETSPRPVFQRIAPLATVAVVFALGLTAFVIGEYQNRARISKRAESELAESTKRIIEQTSSSQSKNGQPAPTSNAALAVYEPAGGFTSRWRLGPENAPIRIVIFSDFQCTDCKAFEAQVRQVLSERSDVSVAAKHFPLDASCNQYASQTVHANACWAARAAEAAGILRGNEGFWQMHRWLFERGGSFSQATFANDLRQLGYEDPQQFINLMMSDQTLNAVRADIDEGQALGIYFTPMVFINGVELRGFYNNPTALKRAVDALAATNPQPAPPTQDKPPLAIGKAVGDWRENVTYRFPEMPHQRFLGPENAPIQIVMWGDYQSSFTAELDRAIRQAMSRRGDIRLSYQHYPMDKTCNPHMQQTMSPMGCWAARAAEGVRQVGGDDAFWKIHRWLMDNPTLFNEAALRQQVTQMGLDANAVITAMNSPGVEQIVLQSTGPAKPYILQGVPTIYVNGKWVTRWRMGDRSILDFIFEEAGRK